MAAKGSASNKRFLEMGPHVLVRPRRHPRSALFAGGVRSLAVNLHAAARSDALSHGNRLRRAAVQQKAADSGECPMLVRASTSRVVSFVLLFGGLASPGRLAGADASPQELRAKADAALDAGNYRDAWDIYRKLALDPNDDPKLVGHDLVRGIDALLCLNREDEVDPFRHAVVAANAKNWRLLRAAADSFLGTTIT